MSILSEDAKKALVDKISAMEERIGHNWNVGPQHDPFKTQFPIATIEQLQQMIADLDAKLKYYNRSGTPDTTWWKAQYPDELICVDDHWSSTGRDCRTRRYDAEEAQWDLDMARMQLMIRTLSDSLSIDPALRKRVDDATESVLQQKEYTFLELKHAIVTCRLKYGLTLKQPIKPVACINILPWRNRLTDPDIIAYCESEWVTKLYHALEDIEPLAEAMHALQKDVDAILTAFTNSEIERIIHENEALQQQFSHYKSKWEP